MPKDARVDNGGTELKALELKGSTCRLKALLFPAPLGVSFCLPRPLKLPVKRRKREGNFVRLLREFQLGVVLHAKLALPRFQLVDHV